MSEAGRARIEAELLAWMARCTHWPFPDDAARFERLALSLFAVQFELCPAYARFCRARAVTPFDIDDWTSIPAVPSGAFKEVSLRCFPSERTRKIFRTSGTSGHARGELCLDTLSLYESSLLATAGALLFHDRALDSALVPARDDSARPGGRGLHEGMARRRTRIRVLAPSPGEVEDSSLSHMFSVYIRELGSRGSAYDVVGGALRLEPLLRTIHEAIARDEAIAFCGTAFAFVHLLEALEKRGLRLRCPSGSRAMETGGFKGRSRELPRTELYTRIGQWLGIASDRIVNQYGMTELGSQFYDSVLVDPTGPRRKLGPPWARVRLIEPRGGCDVQPGEAGVIVVHDLANTGSVAAIETADLGRHVLDSAGCPIGFEVLGREAGAETRGCSIAADAMLEGSA